MKILHTADLHLCEGAAERWAALEKLADLAREKGAAVMAISGDLLISMLMRRFSGPGCGKYLGRGILSR